MEEGQFESIGYVGAERDFHDQLGEVQQRENEETGT